ncbi:MAG: D-alanine--D-alanine ligase [Opitutaceae bacterium]|nr:D-alanine--D-alanine ligase [Opitutaceae bacterium]
MSLGTEIVVLAGGTSPEREVSLRSGRAVAAALARTWPARLVIVDADKLPEGLDARRQVVFSTLHGGFGENGGMQRLLEAAGFSYAGCDAACSALAMDKAASKAAFAAAGGRVARGIFFTADKPPPAGDVVHELGAELVVKPNAEGSSVGLSLVRGEAALVEVFLKIRGGGLSGGWLVEERVPGREISVGVLGGRALGVVEICPKSGAYDYASKYTAGATLYFAPARIPEAETAACRAAAERAFRCLGCRDFARADFILDNTGVPVLLEVNTLPGLTATSLLPKSAACAGLDFASLARALAAPAVERLAEAEGGAQ